MKLFIDTAVISEIEDMAQYGVISGVTTNPSLIAKAGTPLKDTISKIASIVDGPISAEVKEDNAEHMIKEAEELAKIHPNIVIKLPMTLEGIKACKHLTSNGIRTNVTLIFSPAQALMAMEAGASFISPFLGRMDDAGFDARKMLEDIVQIKYNYNYKTEIIAASIRNLAHVELSALAGADIATIPYKVLMKMVEHPLTTAGLKIFEAASKTK